MILSFEHRLIVFQQHKVQRLIKDNEALFVKRRIDIYGVHLY